MPKKLTTRLDDEFAAAGTWEGISRSTTPTQTVSPLPQANGTQQRW